MEKKNTYFVDIDGTIFIYRKFETYKSSEAEVIKTSKQFLLQVWDEGHMIVLTTARPENLREHTEYELKKNGIPYHQLVMGIERGPRYLINDMDPNKPGERAIAINVIRDGGIKS
jgi:ribonucleotide monophosphatase NagD (HAD superfamily)